MALELTLSSSALVPILLKAQFPVVQMVILCTSSWYPDLASIAGGGNDTMVFNDTVGGTLFVSLDSGADSVSFVTLVSGATMHGGNGIRPFQQRQC